MTMAHVAFTGHRGLSHDVERLIDQAVRTELARFEPASLVGRTSLAEGADTLFARAVLDAGGSLTSVIPARDFRDTLPAEHHPVLDHLVARSTEVITLAYPRCVDEAYMAAAHRFLDGADELLAVWDGLPARGHGGTADVVAEARRRDIPVTVIWPDGARRG